MKLNNHLKPVVFDSVKRVDYIGYIFLILGLLLLGFAIYNSLKISNQLTVLRTDVDVKQRLSLSARDADLASIDPEAVALTAKIKKQLNYPWETMFSILEAVHVGQVSLMSIQPNFEKKEVLITAEAEDKHQMLAYVRMFEKQESVNHVELLSQEVLADDQQGRVSFVMMVEML